MYLYRRHFAVGMIIAGFGWLFGFPFIVPFGIGVAVAPMIVEFVSTLILGQLDD